MDMLKPPGHMDFSASNFDEAWRHWEQQFKTYFLACEISKKDPDVQVAILLHTAGVEAQEIHSQFKFETGEDPKNWELVLNKFSSYCKPHVNTVFERYRFWCHDQSQGEPIDMWVKDLRTRANTCEFGDDTMICDKIVFGVTDSRIKERLSREPDLTPVKCLDICHAAEFTGTQLKVMSSGDHSVQVSAVRKFGDTSSPGRCEDGLVVSLVKLAFQNHIDRINRHGGALVMTMSLNAHHVELRTKLVSVLHLTNNAENVMTGTILQ